MTISNALDLRFSNDQPGDTTLLFEHCNLITEAVNSGNYESVMEIVEEGCSKFPYYLDSYFIREHAAKLFLEKADRSPSESSPESWAIYYDFAIAQLVRALEINTNEPELLQLLGKSVYELGHTRLARNIFNVVRKMDPENTASRQALVACNRRLKHANVQPVDEFVTPVFKSVRTKIKSLISKAAPAEPGKISAALIVKNEEEMLPGCLDAIHGSVDEIIVVDTGSSDATKQIALDYGAKVFEFEWNGSFSDARNESLKHASGDWILLLDADEHMVKRDAEKLRALTKKSWLEGFIFTEHNHLGTDDFGGITTHTTMRMCQNRPHYRFSGTVHEQIQDKLPSHMPQRVQSVDVVINHYGYMSTVINSKEKNARNLDLLLKEAEDDLSAFTCFNLATEYGALGQWDKAAEYSQKSFELAQEAGSNWLTTQFGPVMLIRSIIAHRTVGKIDDALELCDFTLKHFPDFADVHYEKALTLKDAAKLDEAHEAARKAIELGEPTNPIYVTDAAKYTHAAHTLIGNIYQLQGQVQRAEEFYRTAIKDAGVVYDPIVRLTDLMLKEYGAEYTDVELDSLLQERASFAAVNFLVGTQFHDFGALDFAKERYDRTLKARPGHGAAIVAKSEVLIKQDQLREAYDLAMSLPSTDYFALHGAQTAWLVAVSLGEPSLLEAPAKIILKSELLSPAERSVYAAWKELVAPQDLHVLVPADIVAANLVLRNLEALGKMRAPDAFETLHKVLVQTLPDLRKRKLILADLYLKLWFVDMAATELLECADRFGPDAHILGCLGKVATAKELWTDAELFLTESLKLDPEQPVIKNLLDQVKMRAAA